MSNAIKISIISAALISSLYAQNSVTLEPLSITSSAIVTDELKSTDAVEIYTSKDIEAAHVQNVYEFLNTQTSVTTSTGYGNPFTQLIDMHGYGTSNGNQNVVISLNGRKLNNVDSSSQLLYSISPASISRIEIIKSSGIVVGGDGANAGVINIVTKKNNDKELSFYMGNNTLDTSFYAGHSDEKVSVSASGEYQSNSGQRDIDTNGSRDKSTLKTATLSASYTPIKEIELRAGANIVRTDVIYASYLTLDEYKEDPSQKSNSFFPYTNQTVDSDTYNVGATYFINDNISLKLDYDNEQKSIDFVGSTTGPSDYDYNYLKTSLDYVSDMLAFSIGYDGFYGDRKQSANTTTKNNDALYVMSQFYLGNSTIKAGYRYEKVSYEYRETGNNLDQDNSLHGAELGYNYMIDKEKSLFVNYAHAYQAPNIDTFFAADYSNWPNITIGFNGFVEPMKTDSYTLGFNHIISNNKFKISAYYIDLTDEIYLHKPDFKNTNIDKSHKYGIDIYDKWLVNSEFNLVLNYNYVQAIIDDEKEGTDDYSGNKLPGVSDHSAKLTLNYLPNKHTAFSLTQVYRSEAYAADDFNNNFSQKQDAFHSTDISVSYAKEYWEVFAKINNLFEQSNGIWIKDDAIYPVNFARTAIAGLKLKF